jgi:hypothetical protein
MSGMVARNGAPFIRKDRRGRRCHLACNIIALERTLKDDALSQHPNETPCEGSAAGNQVRSLQRACDPFQEIAIAKATP